MIHLSTDEGTGGLDPNFDKLRKLHAELREMLAPVFKVADEIFREWPTYTDAERAHHRKQFFQIVNETPEAARFMWLDYTGLPPELQVELEAKL